MRFSLVALLSAAVAEGTIIPGPIGPYGVASRVLDMTDKLRDDPYAPADKPHKRRILTTAHIPVDTGDESCPLETLPYMTPLTVASYGALAEEYGLPNTTFEGFELEFCNPGNFEKVKCDEKYPVAIFSPGLHGSRLIYGAMARDLASHGYVVITVDHPYDTGVVEFPDGTVIQQITFNQTDPDVIPELTEVRYSLVESTREILRGPIRFAPRMSPSSSASSRTPSNFRTYWASTLPTLILPGS